MVLGDDVGDKVHLGKHVHRLGLDDSHKHLSTTCLDILDGLFHGVESALVHKTHQSHADDDNFSVGRHGGHNFLELIDGAEEDGTVESLDIDFVGDGVGHASLVGPGTFFVEVGHFLTAVSSLDEVGGALHEEDAGDNHANAHSGEEVDKDGNQEDYNEHDCVGTRNLHQVLESLEIYDTPAHGEEDAGEDRERYVFHHAPEAQHDGQQEDSMYHAGELGTSARLDVDDGSHGGTGTWQTTEEAGDSVAYALPYELAVGVVLGFGDIVGHNRGEQRIDGAEAV